jgi:hypothetical protein
VKALLHDPLKFGVGWQMVFMNFTVSGVGIFMAVKLDEIIPRLAPSGRTYHADRALAYFGWTDCHHHLLYFADLSGLKGRARRWFGWTVIIMSDLAFGAVTIFSMKRLFVPEAAQQGVVNWTMLLTDIGLASVLVALALFMGWRLVDLFRKKGIWTRELSQERQRSAAELELAEQERRKEELTAVLKETSS